MTPASWSRRHAHLNMDPDAVAPVFIPGTKFINIKKNIWVING